jgi:hypothetical protein
MMRKEVHSRDGYTTLTGQFLQEFLLVEAILKGLASVYKDNRHFVCELAAKQVVGVYINLAPSKASTAFEFAELFLDDLAQVTAFTGVDNHFAQERHRRESSKRTVQIPLKVVSSKQPWYALRVESHVPCFRRPNLLRVKLC